MKNKGIMTKRKVFNPYAKKSKLSSSPTESPSASLTSAALGRSTSTNQPLTANSFITTSTTNLSTSNDNKKERISHSRLLSGCPKKEDGSTTPSPSASTVSRSSHSSVNLHPAERLGSVTVSFQSAEIFSVSELSAMCDGFGRSIRVTGVALQRHIGSDGRVFFVLGDPLVGRSNVMRYQPPARTRQTNAPTLNRKRPLSSFKTPITKKTTLGSSSRNKLLSSSSGSSFLIRQKLRRRLVHHPKTPSSLSSKGSIHLKRPPMLATTTHVVSPYDRLASLLKEEKSTILVVVDALTSSVQHCGVGDLIMVIGELQSLSEDAALNPLLAKLVSRSLQVKCGDEESNPTNNNDENSNTEGVPDRTHYIVPRIIRNVNGTDARLQQEVAMLRRKFFLTKDDSSGSAR